MATLEAIRQLETELTARYKATLCVNADLNRTLVSFQANKRENGYRWFKYKEGFSANLVRYILRRVGIESGRLIDPFAGSGAALFAACAAGLDTEGIELLPVGREIIRARQLCATEKKATIRTAIDKCLQQRPWVTRKKSGLPAFTHLRITNGAFPPETERAVAAYLAACDECQDEAARTILRFAAMCVLEEVSYTRKDGQYLRWDYRSGRRQGAKIFDKGTIHPFAESIVRKLTQIRDDLAGESGSLFSEPAEPGSVNVSLGSCLDILPATESASFDCLLTSPPYCNRYDYTRTYALELAFLGTDEERLKELRQAMVSCTVENREKDNLDAKFGASVVERAQHAFTRQALLTQALEYLDSQKEAGLLNNTGIPRMVRNYFWEMTLVIAECARVLKPGAPLVMVNDNVRYQGAGIPVDLVLSDIAADFGFDVETIWVLPVGKGNSSQQMGKHGRDELRKCVYIWRAPTAKRAKRRGPQLALGR
jgi:DNA modification methylase